ncbi:uncharacterized protein LOC119095993 [Pollicipes pollicipes]|uniref:uncharacterized protein LOC119095993 n=1 Tax=Pollicipes pollicipes TaxID=41117 RepID=UPI0018856632|nr:uncharacterized protein LOC119095993 [Pollicipes pollicipes]XP_037074757.1 uncharacterized protein LOC119095993 [Pollicipes pollicipes]
MRLVGGAGAAVALGARCLLLSAEPTAAAVSQASLQTVADSLSRDQCVQLYRTLRPAAGRLDRSCIRLLRAWGRRDGDAPALRDALRDLGQPELARGVVRSQDEQGSALIADSLREVAAEAATEDQENNEDDEDSDDSDSRPAGRDRPAERDGFGAAGVTLLLTLALLLAVFGCFCAGRAVCPALAGYDPAARRRRQQSVSSRVDRMLRAQRLRGKLALVTGLTSGGSRGKHGYGGMPAIEGEPSAATDEEKAPSIENIAI